ncbi:MAG: hypothetical protein ABJG86_00365 [Nitratireductor sp.]
MCANCGFPSVPGHWTEAGASTPTDRLRARFRRAQLLQSVLPAFGLSVHDDGATPGVTLSDRTGRHEMVGDVNEVWQAAERMSGHVIDPLDPRFLAEACDAEGREDT